MSKRKLSQRQLGRIRHLQEERAIRARSKVEEALADGQLGAEQAGLVISHFGTQLDVEAGDGAIHRCHFRANLGALVTGDEVIFRAGEPIGVVVAVLPRRSLLERPDAYGKLRPVAANIDQIGLVIAPEPMPHGNLIDRYLVAAEHAGIEPFLVVNKTDLATAGIDELVDRYARVGYQVLRASVRGADGLAALQARLDQRNSALVGQSGVGKSSLIKALLPGEDIRVGQLSHAESKGRHTTTTARLFRLPSGGNLIDSPGIREFGMQHLDEEAITHGFREFLPHLGHCRFRDCRHRNEPGCALLAAELRGELSPERLASYRQMLDEMK